MVKKREDSEIILKQNIKEGALLPFYVFYGAEDYIKDHYVKEIRRAVSPELSEFSFVEYEGSSFSLERFYDDIRIYPFSGGKKLIVVRNLLPSSLKAAEKKELDLILKDIPGFCCVIFYFDSLFTEVDYAVRQKRLAEIKALSKNALPVEFSIREKSELTRWLVRHFQSANRRIGSPAALFLLSYTNNDMTSLKGEIEKLINALPEGGEVTEEIIKEIATKSEDAEMFDLTNAVADGSDSCFKILAELKAKKLAAFAVTSGVSAVFREMLYAKAAAETGSESADRVVSDFALSPRRKFLISRYFGRVKRHTMEKLMSCVKTVNLTEQKLKRSRVDEWVQIEIMLAQLLSERG